MSKSKPQTFTMNETTIEKLNQLASATGLKKSTLVQMLINDCTAEKICQSISSKAQ